MEVTVPVQAGAATEAEIPSEIVIEKGAVKISMNTLKRVIFVMLLGLGLAALSFGDTFYSMPSLPVQIKQ